ncbi:LysE family translocator [Maribacter sp. 2304DJ31-5]|uniref:LysE family translocator n=1 Tax=Maribacter sp. 2304DJ31-5 TaxID=3386273 RepID=UPI0039BC7D07
MNSEILISFVLATAVLAISPGPDNIFVLMQSMTHGRKYGFATIMGLMTGCLVHTTLLAFGVSAIIRANESLFLGIKLFGAGYLIYLAYSVFKDDAPIPLEEFHIPQKEQADLFKQGFIMNVLNPKVTIFFLAFFPGFLFSDTLANEIQFYILGFLFILVSLIVFGGIALLAGSISIFLKRNHKTAFILKGGQIIVFLGIAVFLFFG